MAGSITLLNQPLIEERAQQCGERIGLVHACTPPSICKQCAPKVRKRSPASWRFKAGSPQYVDEQPRDRLGRVACSVLVMPEQARLRTPRRSSAPPRFQVFAKCCCDAFGQRQDPGLEE